MKIFAVLKHPQVDIVADIDKLEYTNFQETRVDSVNLRNVAVVQVFDEKPYPTIIPFKMCKDYECNMLTSNIAFMTECESKLSSIHQKEMERVKEEKITFFSKDEYIKIVEERQKKVTETIKK